MCGNYSPRNAVTQSPRKGIKQKVEHGIPCYIEDSKKAVDLHRSKGLSNNYKEEGKGIGKLEGGIGENDNKREVGAGWMRVKFNAYRGHYFFIPFCKLEK